MAGEGSAKEIRIIFKLDEQALQRMRTAIADVTRDLQSFVQASRGLTAGSGGAAPTLVGTGRISNEQQLVSAMKSPQNMVTSGGGNAGNALAASFTESANAMKNLSGVSREAMRVMSDVVTRAAQEQRRAIKDLDSQIDSLTSKYSDLQDAQRTIGIGSQTGSYQAMGQQLGGAVSARQAAASNLVNLEQQHKAIQNTLTPTRAGAGYYDDTGNWVEGSGGPFGAPLTQARQLSPGMRLGLRAGGLAVAGAATITNEVMAESRGSSLMSDRGRTVRGEMERLRSGDLSLMFGLRKAAADAEGRAAILAQTSGTGAQVEQAFQGIFGGIKNTIGAVTGGTAGGGQAGGTLGAFTTVAQQTSMMRNLANVGRQYAEADPLTSMALQDFSGSLGARISAQRLGMVGGSGISGSKSMDPYGDLAAKLRAGGYDIGQFMGAAGSLIGLGGKGFAGKNAWNIMAASAAGYGGLGEVLAGAARSGGNAWTAMGGPGLNAAAGLQLGQGILGSGFDVTGVTSGTGLSSAFQGAFREFGDIRDMNQVARFQAGVGGLNRFAQGQVDQFQQGRNIMSAIGINAGGGIYSQDYLASGMNVKQLTDLARGKGTISAEYMGVTSDMARRQLGAVGTSLLDRFVDQGQGDMMSEEIRKAKASGKSLPDYLASLTGQEKRRAIEGLGVFAGGHGAGGEEAGIGMMAIEAGLSGIETRKLMGRKGLGGGLGGAEKAMAEGQGAIEQQITDSLKALGPGLTDLAKTLGNQGKNIEAFGSSAASADALGKSLMALTGTVDKLNKALGGQAPDHPAMDKTNESASTTQPASSHRLIK
jgi:hypothetical protein